MTLEDIWRITPALNFNLTRNPDHLWGFCGSCYYADVCQAGCTWTSHSLLGRPGNNPYCHHRALELAKQGLRESVVRVEAAPGNSFDHGRFDLILETADGRPIATQDPVENHHHSNGGTVIPLASLLVQSASAKKPALEEPAIPPRSPKLRSFYAAAATVMSNAAPRCVRTAGPMSRRRRGLITGSCARLAKPAGVCWNSCRSDLVSLPRP
jgi:hypothetical protein